MIVYYIKLTAVLLSRISVASARADATMTVDAQQTTHVQIVMPQGSWMAVYQVPPDSMWVWLVPVSS